MQGAADPTSMPAIRSPGSATSATQLTHPVTFLSSSLLLPFLVLVLPVPFFFLVSLSW